MDQNLFIDLLTAKYTQIQSRLKSAIEPLDETCLNWRPNDKTNSIAHLVVFMSDCIKQRIESNFECETESLENAKLNPMAWKSKPELLGLIDDAFECLADSVRQLNGATRLAEQQTIADYADMLHQCATRCSEQLGQVLFLSEMQTPAAAHSIQLQV